MSSTNRSNSRDFHISDFYTTPINIIEHFINEWYKDGGPEIPINRILDPCAGGEIKDGNVTIPMSYVEAIKNVNNPLSKAVMRSIDIRENSLAELKTDYLSYEVKQKYDLIISNPPFCLAMEFINKALKDVVPGGYVVFLLRLNFFGSESRFRFFQENMPIRSYIHSKRIGFKKHMTELPLKERNMQDSCEYQHFIIKQGENPKFCQSRVI